MQRIALEATMVLEREGIIVNILPAPQFDDFYNEDGSFRQLAPVRVSADPVVLILHSSGTLLYSKCWLLFLVIIDYRFYRSA